MPRKWIRKENHSNCLKFREIIYYNSINPHLIEQITVTGPTLSNQEVNVEVYSPEGINITPRSKALRDQLVAAGFQQDNEWWYRSRYYQGKLRLEKADLFIKYLSIVREHEGIDDYDYYDILEDIGILKHEEHLAEKVSSLVEAGNFNDAIKLAKEFQENGYNEIIWELAVTLHEQRSVGPEILIDLYNTIPPNKSHFSEAQGRLVVLYGETEPNKNRALELSLGAAINSGEQRLVDQLFHQLCGRNDLAPSFTNVKGDAATLISLGTHIREMEEKLKTLEPQPESHKLNFF